MRKLRDDALRAAALLMLPNSGADVGDDGDGRMMSVIEESMGMDEGVWVPPPPR